jgi:hypothetical protein
MTGEASTVGAGKAIDGITGRATLSSRTTYLALLTAAPSDSTTLGTMTEVTTSGYSRQAVTWGAPSGDPEVSSNTAAITFGPFSADPPSVAYGALVSASSGTSGDFLYFWTWDTARDGANGDSLNVAIGALTIQLD